MSPVSPGPTPARRRTDRVVALAILGAILLAIVGAIGYSMLGRSASGATIPPGWSIYTSQSGLYSCAYDPTWTTLDESDIGLVLNSGFGSHADLTADFGGYWFARSGTGGALVQIVGARFPSEVTDVKAEVDGWATATAQIIGGEQATLSRSERFVSPQGYDGWYEELNVVSDGTTLNYAIIAVAEGNAVVVVIQLTSDDYPDAVGSVVGAVAASITIGP